MANLGAWLVIFGVLGYVFLRHCCHRTSFRWDALEWQQNVFESTAMGLLIFVVGRLSSPLVNLLPPLVGGPLQGVLWYVEGALSLSHPETVAFGIGFGVILALVANWRWPKDSALDCAIRHHGGSLRILLHTAHRTNRAVLLTLSNRKAYVGWVFTPPILRSPSHVVLFPTLSGYRASDTLAINWTTNYSPAYEDIIQARSEGKEPTTDLHHFQLVIPLSEVTSATYFDSDLYYKHFAPGREGADKSTVSTT